MTETFYHGTFKSDFTPHVGMCLTQDEEAAETYSQEGTVHTFALNTTSLRVKQIELAGSDLRDRIDSQEWPGDRPTEIETLAEECDVIIFNDVDADGDEHQTTRLITAAAVAALVA